MRNNRQFYVVIVVLCAAFLISCGGEKTGLHEHEESVSTQNASDSVEQIEETKDEKRKKFLEQRWLDSLRLERVLSDVLDQLSPTSFRASFSDTLQFFPDSMYTVNVEIKYDYLLNKQQRNLRIRRFSPGLVQIDLFSLKNGETSRILQYEIWQMPYISDTLKDVNGDGLNDFVVNGYHTAGCCLKAFSDVFLTKKDVRSFSEMFSFINPTFSGRERVIRGVCYGHPGETELYKFKWRNYSIDTIEYVSFQRTETGELTGKILISNKRPNHNEYRILRTLSSVPKEYHTIEGFNWFTNEILKNRRNEE